MNIYKLMIGLFICAVASAQEAGTNSYTQTNLVSDISGMAVSTDSHLVNPWGLSRSASSYWWVSDEGTGVSTLYGPTGFVDPLVVTIPSANHTSPGTPTGTVALGKSFVFVTLDGTISQWTSGNKAVMKVNNSSKAAVYTGCTLGKLGTAPAIYVANSNGGVEAYTTAFAPISLPAGAFTDPAIPAGYTPYGIQAIGANIWVTFSSATGVGGYVDKFNANGKLLLSLAQGWFSEPWGVAQAPASFGKFSKTILVGNVGSGWIAAFNPSNGSFLGFLKDSTGADITIPGLWAIYFGGGGTLNGPTTTLFFAAGIDNYAHGLFGSITAN
ncbi:MAG TPA: TIGR03118 family protein [Bryobacteraceae bacterium]|nr:TIGR03118 family protein [Bryobacteraceae bacterium]